ncbi:hypothetical protein [Riemerella anatipestifer]|uniref:Uncharacterized protein n=1 Tax=Riemerella anatipestifer TaxID=34085 RepID=A0AAP6LJZ6_RIEAN|nr:hypothetical protein [Riemerella anatipestifer]MBT0550170.1 hypothetical protein [Riemerella anatipestifer]MBT0554949.1 hypothetical protein [Riemerella anatipestifer]MBT0560912.1 hypothetical protein [Riemerella anatipestifer]MCD5969432.1 hypothetical protein [Riemerella anatipestifer]MCO7355379.1 hypothetical protein [Riemerella anatipestifer]
MSSKNNITSAIIINVIVFFVLLIVTKLVNLEELPTQTIGVLFGGVITALITYFLLIGQTQAEEHKERNVKVFEEKSQRFNTFINKLWEIWDDRTVELEELNELIKLVSRDVVLYTKPETVDIILSNLIDIAEHAKPDKTNSRDAEVTKLIQQKIFNIINELAKDIGLGGEIKPQIRSKLNLLEEKVIPYLIQKDFKQSFLEHFKNTIFNNDDNSITKIDYKKQGDKLYIECRIKESNVYLKIGPLDREPHQDILFTFFVEFYQNRQYQIYRDATKGWRKDCLKGSVQWEKGSNYINFSDSKRLKEEYQIINRSDYSNSLAERALDLYQHWNFNGKNIEDIIQEVEKNNL